MTQQNTGQLHPIIIPKLRRSCPPIMVTDNLEAELQSIRYADLTKERNWIIGQLLLLVLVIPILMLVGVVNLNDSVRLDIVYWLLTLINIFNARVQVKRLNTVNDKMLETIMDAL